MKLTKQTNPIDGFTITLLVLFICGLLNYHAKAENAKYAEINKSCIEIQNSER